MEQEEIEALIERYFMGLTSPAEDEKLHEWYDLHSSEGRKDSKLPKKEMDALKEKMLQALLSGARKQARRHNGRTDRRFFSGGRRIAAAIILLICSSAAVYILKFRPDNTRKDVMRTSVQSISGQNIGPGHNGAVLHLSNGRVIALDSMQNGVVAEQNGVQIIKNKNGITYVGKANETVYNDVITSRGQQWQLTLPDGTRVWLNAASSIHYPLTFNGSERLVSITGEAYFEVVHNDKQPFKVKVGNTLIEDIGTAFNINAYQDEASIKTTLVHGSVKVASGSSSSVLIPGEQAVINKNVPIKVVKVNTESTIGWKNGEMIFDNEDLEEVMRKVSRWYDIDVTYAGSIPKRTFAGSISRKLNLSEFLKLLEFESVSFKLDNKGITILP